MPRGRTADVCLPAGALRWFDGTRMLLALDMRGALENLYILGALEPTKLTQLSR